LDGYVAETKTLERLHPTTDRSGEIVWLRSFPDSFQHDKVATVVQKVPDLPNHGALFLERVVLDNRNGRNQVERLFGNEILDGSAEKVDVRITLAARSDQFGLEIYPDRVIAMIGKKAAPSSGTTPYVESSCPRCWRRQEAKEPLVSCLLVTRKRPVEP
jgi:hypothetical protein